MQEERQSFPDAIERFKAWSEVRLNDREALLLMEHCATNVRSPERNPLLLKLWNEFHEITLVQIYERLQSQNWSALKGQALVLLLQGSLAIRKGMQNFLPRPNSLREEDKQVLWMWYLLNRGIYQKPNEPYCLLEPWATIFIGGAYASMEYNARAAKHPVGFAAGVYGYFAKSKDVEIFRDETMASALKRIAGAARKKIPDPIRPKNDDGKTVEHIPDAKLTTLDRQVAETIAKDFSDGTPEEIIARALDGLLNVVPTAVQMDVFDQNKSDQAGFERALDLESDKQLDDVINRTYRSKRPEEIFETNELIKLLQTQYPQEWKIVHTVDGQGISVAELSEMSGTPKETIKKRYLRAKVRLREYLNTLK